MADVTSACPRHESALSWLTRSLSLGLPRLKRRVRNADQIGYLQVATAIQLAALAVVAFTPAGAHHLFLVFAGLILTLLAMRLSPPKQTETRPAQSASVPSLSDRAPLDHVASAPAPLPFMGERIRLDASQASIARLAHIANRLCTTTAARSHPWSDLLARVSHELRTPLNAVIGFSDVMNSELLGPVGHPRYREYARHIRDCGRELLKSAEDTLAITCLLDHQNTSMVTARLDLATLALESWDFYSDEIQARGITLASDLVEGLEVAVERRPMRQILINLFAEAIRRCDDHGTIGLTTSADGDLVQLEVFVRGRPNSQSIGQASLAICLARALLEMQGAALIEIDDPFSTWRALTVLRGAAQSDFFSMPRSCSEWPVSAHLC